ncbi:hypothetical protein J6590_034874 [Homalodisca vitripennis]|nr:hypothetical protein J6590_034874 [Homalodisca vitripennis]
MHPDHTSFSNAVPDVSSNANLGMLPLLLYIVVRKMLHPQRESFIFKKCSNLHLPHGTTSGIVCSEKNSHSLSHSSTHVLRERDWLSSRPLRCDVGNGSALRAVQHRERFSIGSGSALGAVQH